MNKQGVLGLIIGVIGLSAMYWYNTSNRNKETQIAAEEICSCLEENNNGDISSNVSKTVCLKFLGEYKTLKISTLEEAIEKRCPDLASSIEIVEQ